MSNPTMATYIGQFDGFEVSAKITKVTADGTTVKLYMGRDGFMRVRSVHFDASYIMTFETVRDAVIATLVQVK